MLGKDIEGKTLDTIIIILILLEPRVYLTINVSIWNTSGSQQQATEHEHHKVHTLKYIGRPRLSFRAFFFFFKQ